MMPRIFIYLTEEYVGNVSAFALAEDGTGLAGHISSDSVWAKRDMGLESMYPAESKHQAYSRHYPGGYQLVDLIDASEADLKANEAFMKALDLHMEQISDDPPK